MTENIGSIKDAIVLTANAYCKGDFELAWTICRNLLKMHSPSGDLLHLLGVMAYGNGNRKLGQSLLRQAIAFGSKSFHDAETLWVAYSQMNVLGLARELHDTALRVAECDQVGDIFWYGKQIKAAEVLYRRALEMAPDSSNLHYKLSKILWELEAYDRAKKHYIEHLKLSGTASSDIKVNLMPVMSIRTYCEKKSYRYTAIFPEEKCLIPKPEIFNRVRSEPTLTAWMPEIYVAELKNVWVIAESAPLVTGDGILLHDLAGDEQSERYELSGRFVKFCSKDKALVKLPTVNAMVIDEAIMLSGGSATWSHWLFETLPRLSLLEQFPEYDKLPILVDEASVIDPHNFETLKRLNKTNRDIIYLQANQCYRCKRLIYPSKLSKMPSDMKPWAGIRADDDLLSPRAINFIRKEFYESPKRITSDKKNLIYIPRKNGKYRRLVNETEIQKLFMAAGFTELYPDRISFEEKLEIFGNAGIIAGPGSSAMVNQFFSPPGTIILALMSEPWIEASLHSHISAILKQRLICLVGSIVQGTHSREYHCNYKVKISDVERALENLVEV